MSLDWEWLLIFPEQNTAAVTQHIPDKYFQMVSYYGWYSSRSSGDRIKAGLLGPGDELSHNTTAFSVKITGELAEFLQMIADAEGKTIDLFITETLMNRLKGE